MMFTEVYSIEFCQILLPFAHLNDGIERQLDKSTDIR